MVKDIKIKECPDCGLGTRSGLQYMLATSRPGQSVLQWFQEGDI